MPFFGVPPCSEQGETLESPGDEAAQTAQESLQKQGDVYYVQSPEMVNTLLDVDRSAQRWPFIPL